MCKLEKVQRAVTFLKILRLQEKGMKRLYYDKKKIQASPDRMKQKEAGLRKNWTPLLSDMAMHMEPITIMVRLKRAKMAAARFRAVKESGET